MAVCSPSGDAAQVELAAGKIERLHIGVEGVDLDLEVLAQRVAAPAAPRRAWLRSISQRVLPPTASAIVMLRDRSTSTTSVAERCLVVVWTSVGRSMANMASTITASRNAEQDRPPPRR